MTDSQIGTAWTVIFIVGFFLMLALLGATTDPGPVPVSEADLYWSPGMENDRIQEYPGL